MTNRNYISLLSTALVGSAVATLTLPGFSAHQEAPPPPASSQPRVVLKAATANPAKPEVRVRWTITSGWLAPGGYNLYRIDGGNRKKLNPAPIKYTPPSGARGLALPGGSQLDVAKLMALAETTARDFRAAQPIFGPKRPRPVSSAPVFRDIATGIRQIRGLPGPAVSQRALQGLLLERPPVKSFVSMIRPPVPPPPPPAPTPPELSVEAKQDLMMGSLLQKDVNKTLGLGYDDTAVTSGTAYQYALREIDRAGAESAQDVATVSITVGADPQPPTPAGLEAAQQDPDSVDLRWTRLTADQEAPFGLASYNVTRVSAQAPAGTKLNNLPVVIADIPGNNGQHVEPASFYTDNGVPIGKVTYRLTMVDMFGRESSPASIDFNMEDWFTPRPVPEVQAELRGNDVAVSWITFADPAILYRVYRIDTEDPGLKPLLLTPQPIPGTPVTRPSTPKQSQSMVAAAQRLQQAAALRATQQRGLVDQLRMDAVAVKMHKPAILDRPQPPPWVSFTDVNAPKDHYYRYIVTALFTRNNRDSVEAPSSLVAVPSPEKLPAPTAPKFTFAAVRGRALDNSLAGAATRETNGTRTLSMVSAATKLNIAQKTSAVASAFVPGVGNATVSIFKGIDPNIGGTLTLSWTAVSGKGPIKYKIYKSVATGYFEKPDTDTRAVAAPAVPRALDFRPGSGLQTGLINLKAAAAFDVQKSVAQFKTRPGAKMLFESKAAAAAILQDLWQFVGDTESTTFNEPTQRSHATYYNFRIVPVSRWGVDGTAIDFAVRVPATLAPSTPSILAAFPGDQGQVVLQLRANVNEEEVTRYHVYRKKVDAPISVTAVTPPPGPAVPAAQPAQPKPSVLLRPRPGILQSVQLRGLGGAAPELRQVTPKIGSRALVADGPLAKRIGTGSARFGIIAKESAFSAVAAAVLKQVGMDPAMQALLDLNSYEEVGIAEGAKKDATGLVVYEDKTVTPQQDYVYRVVAENSDTLRSGPSTLTDAKPYKVNADPPVNLVVAKQGAAAKLTWAPGAGGAVGYMVLRKSTPTSPAIQLGGVRKETSYTDFSVFPRVSYIYQVIAVDSSSNVSLPAEVTYTP